jgi:DNA polymerase-1
VRLLFDIEANDLLDKVTVVHTIVITDLDTGERVSYADQPGYKSLLFGLAHLEAADLLVGHNIAGYDIPALRKVYPLFHPQATVRDTLILSRLIWPDIGANDKRLKLKDFPASQVGKHSLEAWGFRLGQRKLHYTGGWEQWSPAMQTYCEGDVDVNLLLWKKIEGLHYSEQAIQLEHDFADLMRMQEAYGFPFAKDKAEKLTQVLVGRRAELLPQILAAFPPTVIQMKTPEFWLGKLPGFHEESKFKTKGAARTWNARDIRPGPLRKKIIPFEPNSRMEIAKRLMEHGWQPTRFTDGGKPETSDAVLEEALDLIDLPAINLLREYLMVQKRISQIAEGEQSWLKLVGPDGRMHGGVITNGAVTGRCSHVNPNMAQVPALKGRTGRTQPYGKECRELFHAPAGWVLVGVDASGLELRCLAHFMALYDGGDYITVVTTGDVHTVNQLAAGLDSRPKAKTFIYAYIYGAADWKLGFTAGLVEGEVEKFKAEEKERWETARRGILMANKRRKVAKSVDDLTIAYTVKGAILRAQFEAKLPAIKKLRDAINRKITEMTPRGYLRLKSDATIKGLDGRIVPIRAKHSALNTLLQGAGALIVKLATVILYHMCLAKGWVWGKDFANVAHVHDELQLLARPEIAEELGKMFNLAIQEAGKTFNFRCPLAGEFKLGQDWSCTH